MYLPQFIDHGTTMTKTAATPLALCALKPGRVYWTVRNLRIGAHLCAGGIRAFANMQACDAENAKEIAARGYPSLLVDWAEFEEGADGKIDIKIAEAGELTEKGLASMRAKITIDDVGDKTRT